LGIIKRVADVTLGKGFMRFARKVTKRKLPQANQSGRRGKKERARARKLRRNVKTSSQKKGR